MRILLVEDEVRLATLLRKGLAEDGFAVDLAASGEEALDWIETARYDVVILDIMLPGIDGIEVCRTLRRRGIPSPVLLLTAKDAVEDRVAGLDAGADDYLVKPFAFAELTARIRALTRRPPAVAGTVLDVAGLRLDPATHEVWRDARPVDLASKEFRILECLMRNPNRVLTRAMIAERVWDYDFPSATNVIDVHIRSLRQKLGDPYPGELIQTVRGAGYRLCARE
jgi:two-component system OmpR family response regulator